MRPVRWGRWDSNPHGFLHMILSHARLPNSATPPFGIRTIIKGNSTLEKGDLCMVYWRAAHNVMPENDQGVWQYAPTHKMDRERP